MDAETLTRALLEAEGYLELGMLDHAASVLAGLPDSEQQRREVLGLRLALHMARAEWKAGAELAGFLVEDEPAEAAWWVNYAYCLRRAESVPAAEAVLLRAADLHPAVAIIPYNLACYACVTGRPDLAKERLRAARKIDRQIEELARRDDDLAALADWIAGGFK